MTRKRRSAQQREAICAHQCSVADCFRQARGNSAVGPLCGMHAQRFVKHGTVDLAPRTLAPKPQCAQCGATVRTNNASRSRTRGYGFCSQRCAAQYIGAKRKTRLEDRFWSKVDARGAEECWPWVGQATSHWGYGRINIDGRIHHANRVAYELTYGAIPPGIFVCHRCDNPGCCNPSHLWLGTALDNTRDMDRKGRRVTVSMTGEAHPSAKLTAVEVSAIRRSAENDRVLARRYCVTHQQIRNIKTGRQWRSLGKEACRETEA